MSNRYRGLTTVSDVLSVVHGITATGAEYDAAMADARLQIEAIQAGVTKTDILYYRGTLSNEDNNFYVFYLIGEDKPRAGYIGQGWEYDAWYDFEHDICGSALGDIIGITTYDEVHQLFIDMNESSDEDQRGEEVRIEIPEIYWADLQTGLSIQEIQKTALAWMLDSIVDSGEPMVSDLARALTEIYGA